MIRRSFPALLALLIAACDASPPPESAGDRPTRFAAPDPRLEVVVVPDLGTLEPPARRAVLRRELLLAERLADADAGDDTLADAYGELGKAYHAFGYPASAAEPYGNAWRLQPEVFQWPYYLARILAEASDPRALETIVAARRIRPGYPPATLLEAELRLDRLDLDAAETLFRQAAAVDSARGAALYGLGRIAAERGAPEAAVEALESALASTREATIIHYPLALAYRQLGEVDRAREHLALRGEVLPAAPDPLLDEVLLINPDTWASRGLNALRLGNYAVAASQLGRAAEAMPGRHDVRLHLGAALMHLGRVDEALRQYRKAVDLAPESGPAHHNLGMAQWRLGRQDEALESLARALVLDPTHKAARFQYARRLGLRGRHEEALEHYDELLALDPGHATARLWRARSLLALGRRTEAAEEASRHRRLHPGSTEADEILATLELEPR